MDQQKQQIVERLKQANNILVTVRSNPSVDQLAACIGMTLALNKLDKHATAVFSGQIPSTIEFLQPEKTIEKNTDSLQDFIIALDKSKADKLRYKVEDTMVKIFITPYRTSINQDDLQFSQGDFNVDVVLALGVHMQADLDQAITSHGRILHDATVMTVNVEPGGELGAINWLEVSASSLSELAVELVDGLDKSLMDGQIATAFLTGIVAETERFGNQKTSPQTMSLSAELLSAGANQQLVATKLEQPAPPPPIAVASASPQLQGQQSTNVSVNAATEPKKDDGTLEISHQAGEMSPLPKSPTTTDRQEVVSGTPNGLGLPPMERASRPMTTPQPPSRPNQNQAQTLPERTSPATIPAAPTFEENAEDLLKTPQIHIDDQGRLHPMSGDNNGTKPIIPSGDIEGVLDASSAGSLSPLGSLPPKQPLPPIVHQDGTRLMTEPPTFDGASKAEDTEEDEEQPTNPLSMPNVGILNRQPLKSQPNDAPSQPTPPPTPPIGAVSPATSMPPATNNVISPTLQSTPTPQPQSMPLRPNPMPPTQAPPSPAIPSGTNTETLSQLEQAVNSLHVNQPNTTLGSPANITTAPPTTVAQPQTFQPSAVTPSPTVTPTPAMPPSAPVAPSIPPTPAFGAGTPNSPAPAMSPPTTQPANSSASSDSSSNDLNTDLARQAVERALNEGAANQPLPPTAALNSLPLGGALHDNDNTDAAPPSAGSPPSTPPPLVPPV